MRGETLSKQCINSLTGEQRRHKTSYGLSEWSWFPERDRFGHCMVHIWGASARGRHVGYNNVGYFIVGWRSLYDWPLVTSLFVGDIGLRRVPNCARLLRVFVYCIIIIGDTFSHDVAICISADHPLSP